MRGLQVYRNRSYGLAAPPDDYRAFCQSSERGDAGMTETSIEAEMQRRRDSDYRPLSEKDVLMMIDEHIRMLIDRVSSIERHLSGEPGRL